MQLRQVRRVRPAPGAPSGFVCQSGQPLLPQPLCPLVDLTTADPDPRGNVGYRPPIRPASKQSATSSQPGRDAHHPRPRQQRLPFHRREADGEGHDLEGYEPNFGCPKTFLM
jgi:hypothetical protein